MTNLARRRKANDKGKAGRQQAAITAKVTRILPATAKRLF